MTEAEFQEVVRALPTRQAQVYRELQERGPLVARGGFELQLDAGPSLSRLAEKGLAIRTGARNNGQSLWRAVTDAGEVEATIEGYANRKGSHFGKRSRPLWDKANPPAVVVAQIEKALQRPDVQELLADPSATSKRANARLRNVQRQIAQLRRARAREFVEAQENLEAHSEFIGLRNNLLDGVDRCRAATAMIEDELENISETGVQTIGSRWWNQLIAPLADGVAKYEKAYALVARLTGADPLPPRHEVIEGDLIEDAEIVLELVEKTSGT